MEIHLKTLTPLWTGGVEQQCDRLHETGIIGSLRWWYEALVRGLGGYACDPTSSKCQDQNHCVACELFGCTGWKRKFRFDLEYNVADLNQREGLKAGACLNLRLIELKSLAEEEKWLLAKAIEVACQYGAIGGKKTLKPQKNPRVGQDYGLVRLEKNIEHKPMSLEQMRKFCRGFRQDATPQWPNLRWFFFVPGQFLWRKQMNALMGLDDKGKPLPTRSELQKFLGSTQAGVSKKLFSFKESGGRIWGYVDNEQKLKEVKEQLEQFQIPKSSILDGSQLLERMAVMT